MRNANIDSSKNNRVLARTQAQELSSEEIKQVSGAGAEATAEVTFSSSDGNDAKADIKVTW